MPGPGEVYDARDHEQERDVGLMVLPTDFGADPDRLARFQRQASAAALVEHPHILTVHNVGADAQAAYIISEPIRGRTLREVLAAGPIPRGAGAPFVPQIADALAAAHAKGVVHGNLTPDSILFTADGMKVVGFGLSSAMGPGEATESADLAAFDAISKTLGEPRVETRPGRGWSRVAAVIGVLGVAAAIGILAIGGLLGVFISGIGSTTEPPPAPGRRAEAFGEGGPAPTTVEKEPAPTTVEKEPAPATVEKEPAPTTPKPVAKPPEPARTIAPVPSIAVPSPSRPGRLKPAPTTVEKEPAPTTVEKEPAPTTVEKEPAPTTVEKEPAPTTRRVVPIPRPRSTRPAATSSESTATRIAVPPPPSIGPSRLVWLDRTGAEAGALGDAADYGHVALSPDATRIAVSIREPGGYAGDIWIIDASSGMRTRVTSDPGDDIAPVWSPDGARIAFASSRGGDYDIYETASDGTGGDHALIAAPGDQIAYDWTPGGGFLMYQTERPGAGAGGHTDLWARRIPGGRAFAFLRSVHRTGFPASSPSGRRYAFVLTDRGSGVQDVYMARFPTYDGRRRVSAGGGSWPRWRADAIFYVDAENRVVSVPVMFEANQAVAGAPNRVSDRAVKQGRGSPYDVSADGLRVLINTAPDESADTLSRRAP